MQNDIKLPLVPNKDPGLIPSANCVVIVCYCSVENCESS